MHVVLIRKQFAFEAAHVLPYHTGKCGRLHGHSYRLDVSLEGPLQAAGPASGMVVDFDQLSAVVRAQIVEQLDHSHLNDVIDNPTCERIVLWCWERLANALPQLAELTLWETAKACATVRRSDGVPA